MGRSTILNKINQYILSGGRRTTAANTRDVLNEMANTYVASLYDTSSNFTSANPVLETKQIGIESDGLKFKIGDGFTSWNSLPYASFKTLSQLLANGNKTGAKNIESDNGYAIAQILDAIAAVIFNNGSHYGAIKINASKTSIEHDVATEVNSPSLTLKNTSTGLIVNDSNASGSYTGGKFGIQVGGGTWDEGFAAAYNAWTILTKGSTTGNFIFGYGSESSPVPRFFYKQLYGGFGIQISWSDIDAALHVRMYGTGNPTDKIFLAQKYDLTNVLAAYNNGSVQKNGIEVATIDDVELANFQTKTADYTLVLADRGKTIEMNVATANTVTIPTNASVAFAIGTRLIVRQYGAGQTGIAGAGGVTINTFKGTKIISQFGVAYLVKRGTNEWDLDGDLTSTYNQPIQLGTIINNDTDPYGLGLTTYSSSKWTYDAGAGGSVAYNASDITMTGGTTTTNNVLRYTQMPMALENYVYQADFTVSGTSASVGAFGLGVVSDKTASLRHYIYIDVRTGASKGNALLWINNAFDSQSTPTLIAFNSGETITVKMTVSLLNIKWECWNTLSPGTVVTMQKNFSITYGSGLDSLIDTHYLSLFNGSATIKVTNVKLTSTEWRYADVCYAGESKVQGFYAGSKAARASDLYAAATYKKVINIGVQGDSMSHITKLTNLISLLKPRIFYFSSFSNDIRLGTWNSTSQNQYLAIKALVEAYGGVCYTRRFIPETVLDQSAMTTFQDSYFNTSKIVPTDASFVAASHTVADGVHPNAAGNILLANQDVIYLK